MLIVRASSSLRSGMTSRRRSSSPRCAKRKPPAVKKEFPPRSASGAFSSTSTEAPASRAARAAQSAALPPPITTTSCAMILCPFRSLLGSDEPGQHHEPERDAVPAERHEAVRLHPAKQPAHHHEGGHRGNHGAEGQHAPLGGDAPGMPHGVQGLVGAGGQQGGHSDQERELGGGRAGE